MTVPPVKVTRMGSIKDSLKRMGSSSSGYVRAAAESNVDAEIAAYNELLTRGQLGEDIEDGIDGLPLPPPNVDENAEDDVYEDMYDPAKDTEPRIVDDNAEDEMYEEMYDHDPAKDAESPIVNENINAEDEMYEEMYEEMNDQTKDTEQQEYVDSTTEAAPIPPPPPPPSMPAADDEVIKSIDPDDEILEEILSDEEILVGDHDGNEDQYVDGSEPLPLAPNADEESG